MRRSLLVRHMFVQSVNIPHHQQWTIVLYGSMLAETLGRPSSWSYTHVDARLPVDKEAFLEGGEWQQSCTPCFSLALRGTSLTVRRLCLEPQLR